MVRGSQSCQSDLYHTAQEEDIEDEDDLGKHLYQILLGWASVAKNVLKLRSHVLVSLAQIYSYHTQAVTLNPFLAKSL